MVRNYYFMKVIFFCIALLGLASCSKGHSHSFKLSQKVQKLKSSARNINPKVLKLALIAYSNAHREMGLDNQGILTVIDYSLPSDEKRLWVFNLMNNKLLYHTYVAHGKNSGNVVATSFSNKVNSKKTSIGLYLTKSTYSGKHGYSLRLQGLDKGFNDNAYKRNIVVHSAKYVSAAVADKLGRVGRSWGCPALPIKVASKIIATIKNGTLLFAYAPNSAWESSSQFLEPSYALMGR